jgi:hypothetical protein
MPSPIEHEKRIRRTLDALAGAKGITPYSWSYDNDLGNLKSPNGVAILNERFWSFIPVSDIGVILKGSEVLGEIPETRKAVVKRGCDRWDLEAYVLWTMKSTYAIGFGNATKAYLEDDVRQTADQLFLFPSVDRKLYESGLVDARKRAEGWKVNSSAREPKITKEQLAALTA